MEGRLTLNGGGCLEIRENGARIQLSVCRKLDGAGLYKVWLYGAQGEMLLGTLIPNGQHLSLTRTVSRDTLERSGCWPITGGKTVLTFSFSNDVPEQPSWRWEYRPAKRLLDPVLSEAAAAWGPMLIRESKDGFQLAAPFEDEHPFPITPLFCLGRILLVDGRRYVAFSFNQKGQPILPK